MNKVTLEYQNWYDVDVECTTANVKVDVEIQEAIVGIQAYLKGEKGDAGDEGQYFFGLINSNTHISTFVDMPIDITIYTVSSVNNSFDIYADGIKYYYYDNNQDYSDQVKIEGNLFTFLEGITRLQIRYWNRLILK